MQTDKSPMDKKIVMYESPEAATYVTNIEGWIDINRRFFGKGEDGEHMARYSSHTHKICECGGKMEKGYTKCPKCRHKSAVERYNALPFKEWDGKDPICTWDGDKYFFNENDLIEYMEYDEDEPMTKIDLLICDPVNFRHIDLETVAGDTHEDWEPDKELCDKIDEFNAYLKTLHPHSWMPGKVRTHYKLDTGSSDR
jgi:hypothetical protein